MSNIKEYFTSTFGITDLELLNHLESEAAVRHFKKGQYAYKVGNIMQEVLFLCNGVFRFFFLDEQGNELTDCFAFRSGEPVFPALDFTRPLPVNIQALASSECIAIPMTTIVSLIDNDPRIMKIYVEMLRKSLKIHWEGKLAMYQFSATERYLWFTQNYGELLDRVTHLHIASFLGISPVTLSRIRGKLKTEEAEAPDTYL